MKKDERGSEVGDAGAQGPARPLSPAVAVRWGLVILGLVAVGWGSRAIIQDHRQSEQLLKEYRFFLALTEVELTLLGADVAKVKRLEAEFEAAPETGVSLGSVVGGVLLVAAFWGGGTPGRARTRRRRGRDGRERRSQPRRGETRQPRS